MNNTVTPPFSTALLLNNKKYHAIIHVSVY